MYEPGDIVAWDSVCGVRTGRVLAVNNGGLLYRVQPDGHEQYFPVSMTPNEIRKATAADIEAARAVGDDATVTIAAMRESLMSVSTAVFAARTKAGAKPEATGIAISVTTTLVGAELLAKAGGGKVAALLLYELADKLAVGGDVVGQS